MSDSSPRHEELADLLDQVFGEGLDADRLSRLEALLAADEEARRFYLEYVGLHQDLFQVEAVLETAGRRLRDREPAVRAVEERAALRRRRWGMAFGGSFAAAALVIFGILLSIQYTWDQPARLSEVRFSGGGAVARVVQVENPGSVALQEGRELDAGPLEIGPGLVRLQFFGGAEVILEGPATLELRTSSSLAMESGRLAVRLGERAIGGFRVEGRGVRVTDLGTEFGFEINRGGSGSVQVYQGAVKAELLDDQGHASHVLELKENQSARFDRSGRLLSASDWNENTFVRRMPARAFRIDLADVVAGGNGRGGGTRHGIDPATGRMDASAGRGRIWGTYRYNPVVLSAYIDGVFVPDGSRGPVQIDSAGRKYAFPATTNGTQDLIRSGGTRDQKQREANYPPVLDGVNYAQPGRSAIGLHANAGITFDLQAFTADEPGYRPQRFEAMAGVIDKGQPGPRADIQVFVDGRLKFSRQQVSGDGRGIRIEIPLAAGDRFLTLVSTDAGNGTGHDWVMFGDASLWMNPEAAKEAR